MALFICVVRQWLQRQQWPVLPAVARSKRALSMPACPPAKGMELTCRLPTCRVQRFSSRVLALPFQKYWALSALIMLSSLLLPSALLLPGAARQLSGTRTAAIVMSKIPDTPEGWRTVLSPNQFAVLREAATEPSGYSEGIEGELEHTLKKEYKTKYPQGGVYTCVGCNAPLYYARTKFNSGCGWPAFYDGVPGAIQENPDPDGMRVEIVCANCQGHLGHVSEPIPNARAPFHLVL